MPAILCPSCQKLINSETLKCPHCGQIRPGMFGLTTWMKKLGLQVDFPQLITVVCVVMYVIALLLDPRAVFEFRGMNFLAPSSDASFKVGMTGSYPVFGFGRWWTLVTAIYLHGGLLHIGFNMMWVRQLGPVVEDLYGPMRLFVIFTVSGVTGFIASAYMGASFTLGASGGIFGLLAAAIVYGRRAGSSMFTQQFLKWAAILFIFGLVFPGVDNWAHGGGFIGGYATSWLFLRQGERREGIGTYALAGACGLLTVFAFVRQALATILGVQ
jgi:rhomboid protease GluP